MAASKYLDVIIAGFGGQGVLLIGNLLAYAGMKQNMCVTYIPVYGVEMRGGTANCTVVLSSDEIGSPIITRPKSLIVMNRPSLDKFQPKLLDGGIQLVNASLVDEKLVDKSGRIRTVMIPANELADKVGNARAVNTIMLGAYVQATGVMPLTAVEDCLASVMAAKIVPVNVTALRAGAEYAAGQMAGAKPAAKPAAKKPAAKPATKAAAAKKPAAKPASAKKAAAKKAAAKPVKPAKPAAKKPAKPAKPAKKK